MGACNTAVIVADVLLRRLCLPLVLIASAVLRYNVLSLVYLLLLFTSLLLPGPHLKAQKASSLLYLNVLVVWSFLAILGHSLFQIVLTTDYADQLQPCAHEESNWRQFGFILYQGAGVEGVDIARNFLPDCVVFLTAVANLVTSAYIVAGIRKMNRTAGVVLQEQGPTVDDESEETTRVVTSAGYPLHIQSYWQLPKFVTLLLDVCIFVTLGLSGVAVPSLTSFTYYAMFLFILAVWSCHKAVKWRRIIRVLRCGMTFYTMLHLMGLYLYQFQAAQRNIPIQPYDTTKSLLARLFGLTPVIFTDCEYPTRMQLHSGLEYSIFVNAALLLLLCLLLATDLRLWINTPDILWNKNETYHLPVKDTLPSPTLHLVSTKRSPSPVHWSHYGTYQIRGAQRQAKAVDSVSEVDDTEDFHGKESGESEGEDSNGTSKPTRQFTWKDMEKRLLHYVKSVRHLLLQMSYVPAIVCMMFWSVLYPSWPALLLLLWACTIWLIPKYTPKNSLFYTSPGLVVYAVGLLLLQYVFSLNLTSNELSPLDGLGQECHENPTPGCRSVVPLIKTAFTMVFFCALYEFVRMKTTNLQDNTTDEEAGGTATVTPVQQMKSRLISNIFYLLSTYWILVVVGSFVLVFISGEPNLLKVVYLVFFLLFLATYQVFDRCWYYICIPVWWGLVMYAALELTLIYTYQFDSVSDAWEMAYNKTSITLDSRDLFHSIGLRKYGINSLRSLCVSLIPPAIFIAVMAIQLRYFNPLSTSRKELSSQRNVVETEGIKEEKEGEAAAGPDSSSQSSSAASSVAEKKSASYVYQLLSYLVIKSKQIMRQLVQISWRILELHLHKFSMLVLFGVVLSEVSAGYWVLLAVSLLVVPFPHFSSILYPLLTLYVGSLLVLKTIYQFPIVVPTMFNFSTFNSTDEGGQCSETLNIASYIGNYSGLVYNYQYSSRINDGGWLGLHKVSNYALYIVGPLCLVLLLSLHFSTKRHQVNFYHSENIKINSWEKGSLFFDVTRLKAERSILMACKYFINHVFEMYGIEITLVMMAIAVAVRIDVYGVFYCVVLGILLVFPRGLMAPLWLLYLVVHGLLLLLQYSMLLGVPPGACFYPGGERGYPWDVLLDSNTNNFGMKKWLVLSDYPQMLDKFVLYVDFVVYILLCLQVYNFRVVKELSVPLTDFLKAESLINYIKIFVTRYLFWVSIFLVFFAAISRVSFFGFLYLLVCFALLYRGQNMLMDQKNKRIKSWAGLRLLAWTILLVRVSVQIVDCVFYADVSNKSQCSLILAFNGGCDRKRYYGSPDPNCGDYPNNVGLWVDVLTFAVFTIQIAIFDTQYSEMMREYLMDRNNNASQFSAVLDEKIEQRQQKVESEREKEIMELNERVQQLSSSENTIDHILHAGVRVPSNLNLIHDNQDVQSKDVCDSLDVSSEQPKRKLSTNDMSDKNAVDEEASKLSRIWKLLSFYVIEIFDWFIGWLERSSALYVDVVDDLKKRERSTEHSHVELATAKDDSASAFESQEEEVHKTVVPSESQEATVTVMDDSLQQEASLLEFPVEEATSCESAKKAKVTEDDGIEQEEDKRIAKFENELNAVAEKYSKRPVRFFKALKNALLAHAEFVIYFLVILNVVINGSVISLGYVILLFAWGIFCIPWPTKTFWLSITFYSMLVLVLKYAFQFYKIDYHDEDLQSETGYSTPGILGIEYYPHSLDFFKNAVWDMLLLIALLINRGLLKQYGLWRDYSNTQLSIIDRIKRDTKLFYYRLLNPDISRGASDYYVIMLFFDVLCMITIVFGVSSFGVGIAGEGVGQAASFIQNNYVPLPFVIMLLLHFISMLIDRAIYLRHALKTKFAFQILLLVVWNSWLLFILPSASVTNIRFTKNPAAQCLYFFKCLYFIVSAMQIVSGYPTKILGYFFGRHYTTISGILFSGYRAIPLLPELREVMDWVFTDTALSLFNWLRVQEIYAKLYLVKVRRHREENSPRELGDQQSLIIKALLGGILLVILVLLIWGPLLLMSLINTTSVANLPVATSISLSLDGYEPLVQISVQQRSIEPLNNSEYQQLISSFPPEVQLRFGSEIQQRDFRKATFPGESTSLWIISPPAKLLLLDTLINAKNNNISIAMQFSWKIQREPVITTAAEVVSGLTSRMLNYQDNPSTIDNLISALDGNKTDVSLSNLYPRLIHAPATGQSGNYTDLSRFFNKPERIVCNTSLSSVSNQEWWRLDNCTNPIYTGKCGPPVLLIYSERVASQILSVIAGFGIIGLYVSVVLVIGRLIRNYVSSLPTELLLDEIVNPDRLLKLCNDIFVVRQSRDFKLEEILVGKLFAIFRSPERLISVTETKKSKQD